jgi:peroxiredoxin Q/BCP
MTFSALWRDLFVQWACRCALTTKDRDEAAIHKALQPMFDVYLVNSWMVVDLVAAVLSLVFPPTGVALWVLWLASALLGVIWYSIIVVQIPLRRRFTQGFDSAIIRSMIRWNWVRICCWSLRLVLLSCLVLGSQLHLWPLSSSSTNDAAVSGLHVGDAAPDFRAETFDGHPISLADYRGQRGVILFFYPRDGTSVCTKEACAFRDAYEKFTDAGFEVIGISSDSVESHRKFSQEHKLSYPLISDADGSLRRMFSVTDTLGLIPKRVTFVIDKQGVIRLIFSALLASDEHVEQALRALNNTP